MQSSWNKRLLLLAIMSMALMVPWSVVALAAEPATAVMVTVQVSDTGMPERTYDHLTVTQVIRDGETLTLTGVLTNGRPQERANIRVRIPVTTSPTDLYWQQLYERQRTPLGE
jgi:hypothetical protein